jgi:hypothetical protein
MKPRQRGGWFLHNGDMIDLVAKHRSEGAFSFIPLFISAGNSESEAWKIR